MAFDDIAALLLDFIARIEAFVKMLAAWATGPADGGPNSDGRYPLPTGSGTTTLVDGLALITRKSTKLNFERRTLSSGATMILTLADDGKTLKVRGTTDTANINVQVPGNAPEGWGVTLIQAATGGPRVTITIGTNSAGESGFLKSFGGVFRLAGESAFATVVCTERSSSGRSTMEVGGNLVQ